MYISKEIIILMTFKVGNISQKRVINAKFLPNFFCRSDQLVMTPVWRLSNGHGPSWHFGQAQVTTDTSFQVIIEGIWGTPRASGYIAVDDVTFYDGACSAEPETASVVKGVCSFDRDSCGWRNTSTVCKNLYLGNNNNDPTDLH